MRIRIDKVFVSSVLFTLSLLILVPHNVAYASMWHLLASKDTARVWAYYLMMIGSASLALVMVGLIVLWTGYIKREIRAWLVMFVIVWVFAFPVYILPMLLSGYRDPELIDWSGWLRAAVSGPGPERDNAKASLVFLLMVVALLLPVKAFFKTPSGIPVGQGQSPPGRSG